MKISHVLYWLMLEMNTKPKINIGIKLELQENMKNILKRTVKREIVGHDLFYKFISFSGIFPCPTTKNFLVQTSVKYQIVQQNL